MKPKKIPPNSVKVTTNPPDPPSNPPNPPPSPPPSPSETKKTAEQEIEEAWKPIVDTNPMCQVNLKTKAYRCTEHPDAFNDSTGARNHFRSKHNMHLDGTPYKKEVESPPGTTTQNEGDLEKPLMPDPLLDKINELISQRDDMVPNVEGVFMPEMVVLRNINKDIADGATRIAKNIDIQYFFYKTKTISPKNWTFDEGWRFISHKVLKIGCFL